MIIHEHNNRASTLQYYDCLSTLANQQIESVNTTRWQGTINYHSKSPQKALEWYGMEVPELRGCLELYGWGEGAVTGQEKFGHIKAPPLPSIKKKRTKGPTGHTLNITSIYNGNFDKAWSTTKRETSYHRKKRSGNVNVVIDVTGSSDVHSSEFFWRGAVGVMLAKALQKSGRNVRILVAAKSSGYTLENGPGSDNICTIVNCKDYGAPIALDRLFSMTALAGFFRYYIFKAWCSQKYELNYSFGRPSTVLEEDLVSLVDGNPIIIVSDIWNQKCALEVVDTLLERFK